MNKYELTVVLNVKLEDEQRAAAIERVGSYITRFGGIVINVDERNKKRLAYGIQRMREVCYYFVQFEPDSACSSEAEAHTRIMEPVIGYLCIRAEA